MWRGWFRLHPSGTPPAKHFSSAVCGVWEQIRACFSLTLDRGSLGTCLPNFPAKLRCFFAVRFFFFFFSFFFYPSLWLGCSVFKCNSSVDWHKKILSRQVRNVSVIWFFTYEPSHILNTLFYYPFLFSFLFLFIEETLELITCGSNRTNTNNSVIYVRYFHCYSMSWKELSKSLCLSVGCQKASAKKISGRIKVQKR